MARASNVALIATLHPALQLRVWAMIGSLANQGISVRVLFGYRTLAEQRKLRKLYKAGKGGKAAKAGWSWHNYGLACDMVPFDDLDHDLILDKDELRWDTALWKPFGIAAERFGLAWGKSFGDKPHVSFHPGLSIRDVLLHPDKAHDEAWGNWSHA